MDALTSLIVFWRYYKAIRGKNANENLACVYLGVIIVVSAFAIMAKAVADIITQTEAENVSVMSSSGLNVFFLHPCILPFLPVNGKEEITFMDDVSKQDRREILMQISVILFDHFLLYQSEWLLWLSLSGAVAFILASVAKYWLFTYLLNDSILVDGE